MLKKIQEKAINKLTQVHPNQTCHSENEKDILDHRFKSIAKGKLGDFFLNESYSATRE